MDTIDGVIRVLGAGLPSDVVDMVATDVHLHHERPHRSGRSVSRFELALLALWGVTSARVDHENRAYYPALTGPGVVMVGAGAVLSAVAIVAEPASQSLLGSATASIGQAIVAPLVLAMLVIPKVMKVGRLVTLHTLVALATLFMAVTSTPTLPSQRLLSLGLLLITLMMPVTWAMIYLRTRSRACTWSDLPGVLADHRVLHTMWRGFGGSLWLVALCDLAVLIVELVLGANLTLLAALSLAAYIVGLSVIGTSVVAVGQEAQLLRGRTA